MTAAGRASAAPYRTARPRGGAFAPSFRWVGYVAGALHAASGTATALVIHALLTDRTCDGEPRPEVASALALLVLAAIVIAAGVGLQLRFVRTLKYRWRTPSRTGRMAWQLACLGPALASFGLCAVLAATFFPFRLCMNIEAPSFNGC